MLKKRVQSLVDSHIQKEQYGIHPGLGTLDQFYTLVRVLKGAWEFAQTVHMCFVDLEKAIDRVLSGGLQEYGEEGPFLQAVQSQYKWTESLVLTAGSRSDPFPVTTALCHRFCLSDSQGVGGVLVCGVRILSLFFCRRCGPVGIECEAAGMKINSIQFYLYSVCYSSSFL